MVLDETFSAKLNQIQEGDIKVCKKFMVALDDETWMSVQDVIKKLL